MFERFDADPAGKPLLRRQPCTRTFDLGRFHRAGLARQCPALSLPLEQGTGLQLVGLPGSDLRLLELGTVLAAVIEAEGQPG